MLWAGGTDVVDRWVLDAVGGGGGKEGGGVGSEWIGACDGHDFEVEGRGGGGGGGDDGGGGG